MKTIHKFRIDQDKAPTRLRLKSGYRVVRCEYLLPDKGVYLWVEQSLKVVTPTVERQFVVAFSGEPVPDRYRYLDTALDPFGPEAYHVFEVPATSDSAVLQATPKAVLEPATPGRAGYQPIEAN